jgi:hypothetical protein
MEARETQTSSAVLNRHGVPAKETYRGWSEEHVSDVQLMLVRIQIARHQKKATRRKGNVEYNGKHKMGSAATPTTKKGKKDKTKNMRSVHFCG